MLRLIDERKNLTVRIVPCAAPNNPAQYGGIHVFHFGDLLRPVGFLPVAYGPSALRRRTVADTGWFKSSYSGSGNDACVECRSTANTVRVRDSKNPAGSTLVLPPATFTALVDNIKSGQTYG